MTKRMTQIVRTLIAGGRLKLQGNWTTKWLLQAPAGASVDPFDYVNADTIQRMKNLDFLSYRDEAGNHLGTLKPTPKALEELAK